MSMQLKDYYILLLILLL